MADDKPKYWTGGAPLHCDFAKSHSLGKVFIDGKTKMGPWANMCSACHKLYGVGLGLGRGQKYELQGDARWLKTAG